MKIKRIAFAVIGLALAASVSATPIQSDGTLTLTPNAAFDGRVDVTEKDNQATLSISRDSVMVITIATLDFRSPKFTLSSTDDKQALELTSIDSELTELTDLIYEVGWQS
jgi:hypothetical protein